MFVSQRAGIVDDDDGDPGGAGRTLDRRRRTGGVAGRLPAAVQAEPSPARPGDAPPPPAADVADAAADTADVAAG